MDQQSLQANLARMRAQATKKRGVQTMVCSTQADRPLQHTPAVGGGGGGGGGGGAPPGALPFPTQHAQHLAEAPDETQGQEKIRKQLERVGIAPTVDATLEPFRRPDPVEMGRLDVTDTRSFLGQPPPRVGMIQCYIEREKAGNKYNFYLDERNVFLLAAVKRPKNKTSNYLISLDKDDLNRESGHFYGKLRANFVGTDFTIFDKGEKPGKEGVPTGVSTRQELGAILYERNILGTKGPRKMSVLLPAVDEGGKRSVWRPPREEVGMAAQFRKGNTADMMILKNKDPSWNEQLRAYVLNFQGRVKLASVKNFQLVDQDNPNKVLMQFGKVDTNRFIVDFQFPVCGLQAFAIALSAFDNKLACE